MKNIQVMEQFIQLIVQLVTNLLFRDDSNLYEMAIDVYRRNGWDEDLARALTKLGAVYITQAKNGENPSANLPLAIAAYQEAAHIQRRNELDKELARTLNNLGHTYSSQAENGENPGANLPLAIAAYQEAAHIQRRNGWEKDLAKTLYNLGHTYSQKAQHRRNSNANLKLAIAAYKEAEDIQRRSGWRKELARTLNNLGGVYITQAKNGENPSANLPLAIAAYQEAAHIRRRNGLDKELARTLNNLGLTYSSQAENGENPSANPPLAFAAYEEAEDIQRKNGWDNDLADTLNNLGRTYMTQAQNGENPSANLQLAIIAHQKAEEIERKNGAEKEIAETLTNLGVVYITLAENGENPSANLQLAITAYQKAINIQQRNDWVKELTLSLTNLGITYSIQAENGENPSANLQLAIAAYKRAASIRLERGWLKDLVDTLNNLGNSYQLGAQIGQTPNADIERAINFYKIAENIARNKYWAKDLAKILSNLGAAYTIQARNKTSNGENPTDSIQLAIDVQEEAKDIQWNNCWLKDLADTFNNLGISYQSLAERGQEPNLNIHYGIFAHQESAKIRRKIGSVSILAKTWINLGTLHTKKASIPNLSEDPTTDRKQATKYYRQALKSLPPGLFPFDCLKASRSLGDLGFRQGNWLLALEGYKQAIRAIEQMHNWSTDDVNRQKIIGDNLLVYANAIQAAANLNRYDLMLEFAERGRSRLLVDLIRNQDLYSQGEIPLEVAALKERLQAILEQIEAYRHTEDRLGDMRQASSLRGGYLDTIRTYTETHAAVQELEHEYNQVLAELRSLDPIIAGQIAVDFLKFEEVKQLIPHPQAALLYCYTTDTQTFILILTQTQTTLHTSTDAGFEQLQVWLYENWSQSYDAISQADSLPERRQAWQERMPQTLKELSQKLNLAELFTADCLQGITELIIVPHIELHHIPWSALPIDKYNQLLGERFILRVVPSCQILSYCKRNQSHPINPLDNYAAVINADLSLPGAEFEGKVVANLLKIPPERQLIGSKQATRANYLALLNSGINGLLSSHHAQARRDNPFQSALLMANEEKINVGTLLISRYPALQEVVIPDCETLLGNSSIIDDVITLTTGFISAGASTVISSLWSVDDLATAFFTVFYHIYRRAGQRPAVAVQQAQEMLRTIPGDKIRGTYYDAFYQHLQDYEKVCFQQVREAKNQGLEDQRKTWQRFYQKAGQMKTQLEEIVRQDRPFKAPQYWAGFVCQGWG
jgi:CHAT domain-containing protein/tetratricopeptide (TPR) repeat protein